VFQRIYASYETRELENTRCVPSESTQIGCSCDTSPARIPFDKSFSSKR